MSIFAFLEYISLEKKSSEHTMKAYQANLIAFESYLKSEQSQGGIETASYGEIRTWIVTLIESGNSSRTVNRKV